MALSLAKTYGGRLSQPQRKIVTDPVERAVRLTALGVTEEVLLNAVRVLLLEPLRVRGITRVATQVFPTGP